MNKSFDSDSSSQTEPMVIGSVANTANARQQEIHHKMIERIKDFHSKLDITKYGDQEKIHMLVCSICFAVYTEPDVLKEHFIKVVNLSLHISANALKFNWLTEFLFSIQGPRLHTS